MTDHLLGLLRGYPDDPSDLRLGMITDALDDAGQHERAELVRVQCELAKNPNCLNLHVVTCGGQGTEDIPASPCGECAVCALRRREAELLREWGRQWIPSDDTFGFGGRLGVVRYGDAKMWASFRRGLLHVAAPLADLEAGLRRMGDEAWWVGSVRVTNKDPGLGRTGYWWFRTVVDAREPRYWIPEHIFGAMVGGLREDEEDNEDKEGDFRVYPTPDDAHADLSRALLASVREPGRVAATTKGG